MLPFALLSSAVRNRSRFGKSIPLFLVWLLFCITARAADPSPLSSAIDGLVKEQIHAYNIPGLSIAVTRHHQIIFSQSYGLADVENQVRVYPETLFRIGSITKPITAAATMVLAERRQLDLDVPVQRYCEVFPEKSWPVTTRELLAHL